ncbi:MAG: hypothetical protein HQL15_09570 [Candidatus Omnitrophica bacterium]|nr:hypothetical protein [Candidatus Omnitrophota bacterium]
MISPSGAVSVNYGDSKVFKITPKVGYRIDKVVNESNAVLTLASNNSFTFDNVSVTYNYGELFKEVDLYS